MNKLINLVKNSLIRKIIFVFVISTIAFISLVGLSTRYMFDKKIMPKINNNNLNYTQLLIMEIGSVTDTLNAGIVADKRDLFIAIKNDTLLWKSSKEYDFVDLNELEKSKNFKNVWSGFDHGHHVVYKIDGTYIYFSLERMLEGFSYFKEVILLLNLFYFIIIIYILFRVIKHILKPVSQLTQGVKKVTAGKFNENIKTTRTDELGILINSYNDMSQQVSKMIKSKEQLLLDVSHEMRSPLTRMKLSLEFIEEEKVKGNILEDVNDLDKMITELLESERMNSTHGGLNKNDITLNNLIKEVAMQYSKVTLIMNSDEININADKERLRLLFKNLIENAIKYSENSNEPVLINVVDKKDNIQISIQDNGEGIPENQLEFIFEPFYRVDKSRTKDSGGFGLGLHLCKNIVEAHKGEISVLSKIGEGTTFNIVLPK